MTKNTVEIELSPGWTVFRHGRKTHMVEHKSKKSKKAQRLWLQLLKLALQED